MPQFVIETEIGASPETCFCLMRDPRLHPQGTVEIHGPTTRWAKHRPPESGQKVTFEGQHFGLAQRLTVEVTGCTRPHRFVDEMVEGRFRSFKHVHEFVETAAGTTIRDTVIWSSRLGILGRLLDLLIIKPHLADIVSKRNERIRQIVPGQF